MAVNEELKSVVREIWTEIMDRFRTEGADLNSREFLSGFPYAFIRTETPDRRERLTNAAFSSTHGPAATRAIEAAYSDHVGGSVQDFLCDAVEDFLNYAIPRTAGLPDEDDAFEELYSRFDSSLFGETCLVTAFAILQNVWDHGRRAVLPPGFSLQYANDVHSNKADSRWIRDQVVPYLEISKAAHPIGRGREIKDKPSYFLLAYSTPLRKDKGLIAQACALRDEITKKFIFSVRLLNQSAAFSHYRGFRTLGHLSPFKINLMNFPDDYIERGLSFELGDRDATVLWRLLPKLANESYSTIAVMDMKIEDAIRRTREPALDERRTAVKVAIDQLLDYFQILEAVVPAAGSEYIALYSAVLLKASGVPQFAKDPYAQFKFIKRMYSVRNDVMHGRLDEVLASGKDRFDPADAQSFKSMVHVLTLLFVLNGKLRDPATKLALGQAVNLDCGFGATPEELNQARRQQPKFPAW